MQSKNKTAPPRVKKPPLTTAQRSATAKANPKGSAQAKLDAFGINEVCRLTVNVCSMLLISKQIGVDWNALDLWIHLDPERARKYERAREAQALTMAEQIITIADECRQGVKTTTKPDGSVETVVGDMVERSRLQIDARKWLAGKMAPKKYGDRLALDADVKVTTKLAEMSDADLLAIAARNVGK